MLIKILPLIVLLLVMNGSMLMGIGVNNRQERAFSVLNSIIPGYPLVLLEPALAKYNLKNDNDKGMTQPSLTGLLFQAVAEDNFDLLKKLIKTFGEDINQRDSENMTLLHHAAERKKVDTLKFLINNGADINATNDFGDTPLHMASESGHLEIVKELLANSAQIDAQDRVGNTPLHIAAQKKHTDIFNLLIKAGADVNLQNVVGKTPSHIWLNMTLLHIAAGQGDLYTAKKLLVNNHADVNAQDIFGRTPLDIVNEKLAETPIEAMESQKKDQLEKMQGYLQKFS